MDIYSLFNAQNLIKMTKTEQIFFLIFAFNFDCDRNRFVLASGTHIILSPFNEAYNAAGVRGDSNRRYDLKFK